MENSPLLDDRLAGRSVLLGATRSTSGCADEALGCADEALGCADGMAADGASESGRPMADGLGGCASSDLRRSR